MRQHLHHFRNWLWLAEHELPEMLFGKISSLVKHHPVEIFIQAQFAHFICIECKVMPFFCSSASSLKSSMAFFLARRSQPLVSSTPPMSVNIVVITGFFFILYWLTKWNDGNGEWWIVNHSVPIHYSQLTTHYSLCYGYLFFQIHILNGVQHWMPSFKGFWKDFLPDIIPMPPARLLMDSCAHCFFQVFVALRCTSWIDEPRPAHIGNSLPDTGKDRLDYW